MNRLVGRRPEVSPEDIVASLVPPPHFSAASFDSYEPDANYLSQAHARDAARSFAREAIKRRGLSRYSSAAGRGLYLDGGFGVGKTHLLAAMAREAGKKAAFGTFVEYTHVVGVLGFVRAREALTQFRLVCIDEFELDDPGDTLIMARLMRELSDAGVYIAATSNTLPESLGQGRFAADDFAREIQAVASVFTTVSIDGPDFRRRGDVTIATVTEHDVRALVDVPGAVVEDFKELVDDLRHVHPSKLGAYVDSVNVLGLVGVGPLDDQSQALRWVSLVDRLYDRNVAIAASGDVEGIFTSEMLRGGYRKKYFRALSRMSAMSQAFVSHSDVI